MKTIKYLSSLALLATLTLAACTNGEHDLTAPGQTLPPGAVYLTGSIAGRTDTRAAINPDGSGTFTPGDVWGLYTWNPDLGFFHMNIPFTVNSTVLYWEEMPDPSDVTFSAHYPRQTSVTDPLMYPFDVADAFQSDPDKADLLAGSATGSEATNSATNPVIIPFRHLMHSLSIYLTEGTGAGTIDAHATVELLGMKSTVDVNLIDGKADYENASGDTPYPPVNPRQDNNTGQWYAPFIVAPQSVTTGAEWIKITLTDGNTYIYKVPATLADGTAFTDLQSGLRLTLNLTLMGKHGVYLTSSDISPWNDQGTIDGEANLSDNVKHIRNLEEFVTALTTKEGTPAEPVHYILDADIELDAALVSVQIGDYYQIEAKGHKVIDGAGQYTMTRPDMNGSPVSISSPASTSLKLTRVTLANKANESWFHCIGGELTLGEGVIFDNQQLARKALISVSAGGTLTVDGATFIPLGEGTLEQWISAADAGTHLVLKDYEFQGNVDYISIHGGSDAANAPRLSLRPGAVKPVRLFLEGVGEDFAILPTEGTFTDTDAAKVFINGVSTIIMKDPAGVQSSLPGSLYTFFTDPAGDALRLARKVSTADELRRALASNPLSGDPARPTRILLTADITVPPPTDNNAATYILSYECYVEIDGGTAGHTLTRAGTAPIFELQNGASLRLTRLTMDGEGKTGYEFISVGSGSSDTGTLTLGNGFRLTRAKAPDISLTNGIWVNATLVMEDGAEITGNGAGQAVYIAEIGTLHLKGGKISGNSGDGLYLSALLNTGTGDQPKKPTVTVDNALPSGSAFDVFLYGYTQDATTVYPGAESVITVGSSYPALTDGDLSRFRLTGVRSTGAGSLTTGFALRLSQGSAAIGLVATPQAAVAAAGAHDGSITPE